MNGGVPVLDRRDANGNPIPTAPGAQGFPGIAPVIGGVLIVAVGTEATFLLATILPAGILSDRYGRRTTLRLLSILFVVGACVTLFWNEGRAVQTAKSLAEGASPAVLKAMRAVLPGTSPTGNACWARAMRWCRTA